MDINTKTIQHQAVVMPSLQAGSSSKQPVDAVAKTVEVNPNKTETSSASADIAVKEEVKPEELKQAVSKLNDYVQNMQRDLQFSVDKDSGVTVVKVIDSKTDKVIRQIPNEETLKLARSLVEQNENAAINIFSSRA